MSATRQDSSKQGRPDHRIKTKQNGQCLLREESEIFGNTRVAIFVVLTSDCAKSCINPIRMASHGAKYCCAINCSNNSRTVDPRTGKRVKMHSFPNSVKERERCLKWIVNIRRADLNLSNIRYKRVCSVHFETKAYACPTDIYSSSLLPQAMPTLITCPNPPKQLTGKRKAPTPRVSIPKITVHEINEQETMIPCSSVITNCTSEKYDFSTTKKQKLEQPDVLDTERKRLESELMKAKYKIKLLTQQNARLRALSHSKQTQQLHYMHMLAAARREKLDGLLSKLPPIPASLFRLLLSSNKKISWKTNPDALKICLAIYFRSSAAYNVFRSSGFKLPHPRTLRRQYSDVLQDVGLCPKLFEMLKIRASALKPHERRISLSLDGMTLKQALKYDKHKDGIFGLVNFGSLGSRNVVADQGVLLMVRGLTLRWKQIIGYYIVKHSISSQMLSIIIEEAVRLLQEVGLIVDVIVMDQESSQWKWIEGKGVTCEKPYVIHGEVKSYIIPDPPHLIKNLRNNFTTKNIIYNLNGKRMVAKWEYIHELYKKDSMLSIRTVPKLTEEHFSLPRGKKMKVLLACQIFSKSVSAGIKFYVSSKLLPDEALQTAEFVDTVNSMWDFVDSNSLNAPGEKKAISSSCLQQQLGYFNKFITFVQSWNFVPCNGKRMPQVLPSHKGWLLCLHAMKDLCVDLIQNLQVLKFICLRKCNQDHVENMHSQIRGYNGFNDHPKLDAYTNAIRCLACSISTSELLDSNISRGRNCQSDKTFELEMEPLDPNCYRIGAHGVCEQFNSSTISREQCVSSAKVVFLSHGNITYQTEGENVPWEQNISASIGISTIESEVSTYIAGSVIRKIAKHLKTYDLCEDCLIITKATSASSQFQILKEYAEGSLICVSDAFVTLAAEFEQHFQKATSQGIPLPHPRSIILHSFFENFQADPDIFQCPNSHMMSLLSVFLTLYCNVRLYHLVKKYNESLKKGKKGSELNKCKKLNL